MPLGVCTRPGSQVLGFRYPHAVVMGASETAVSSFIHFPGAALLWLGVWGPGRGQRMAIFVDGAGYSCFRSACMCPWRWRYRQNTRAETGLAQGCCVHVLPTSHHACRAFRRNSTRGPGLPGDMKVYLPTWEHRINLDRLLIGFITCKGLYRTGLHLHSARPTSVASRPAAFSGKGALSANYPPTSSSVAGTGSGICVHLGVLCMFETSSVC